MRILTALAVSFGLMAAGVSGAQAQSAKQISQTMVGPWAVIGFIAPNGMGYCSAERDIGEIRAAFIRFPNAYGLVLRSPTWFLNPANNYQVRIVVAAVTDGTVTGKVISSDMILAQMPSDPQMMRRIAEAGELEVTVADTTVKVPLDQFVAVLDALETCLANANKPQQSPQAPAQTQRGPIVPPRAPFQPSAPPAFPTQRMPLENLYLEFAAAPAAATPGMAAPVSPGAR